MRTALNDLLGVEAPLVGFNRSPGVVAEVSRAGGLGVLAATAYTPAELDAQLTWIEKQVEGRPYGVDLLVPGRTAAGDPRDLVASLRAQIPDEHVRFVEALLERYDIPPASRPPTSNGELAVNLDPSGVPALLDVVFTHPVALVANALGTPPPTLVERGHAAGVVVASLVGKPEHAVRQLDAGVDLLVAQGTEAGGHTGTIATMILTPEIVDIAGNVPVLAAGGIASGRQMAAALALVGPGQLLFGSDNPFVPLPLTADLFDKFDMPAEQKAIYYLTADTLAAAQASPHLEGYRSRGFEVLLLVDRVDEWLVMHLQEFEGKPLQSCASGAADLAPAIETPQQARQEGEYAPVLERLQKALSGKIEKAQVSRRLVESPACLVESEHGVSRRLERMFREAGQTAPATQPVLEINPTHPLLARIKDTADEAEFGDLAALLYDQAVLAEGGQLDDPAAFVKRLNSLILAGSAPKSSIIIPG